MSAPDLTTHLTPGLCLKSPLLAAETLGYGEELADLVDVGIVGALITPTITREPHPGNPMPRTVEASAGLLHSTGLVNPGLQSFLKDRLPRLRTLPCPCIVRLLGETPADWKALAGEITAAGGAVALELNLTPLSLLRAEHAQTALPEEAALRRQIAESVAAVRSVTDLPLIAGLPSAGVEIGHAAQDVVAAGADCVSVGHTFPGVAVRLSSRQFRLPGVVGGLSGPSIKPLALYQVWRVAQCVSVPILGGGGIMRAEDALEFCVAGATALSVGMASLISPSALSRMTDDLRAYLARHAALRFADWIGAAHKP
jgi:dihydroorotate dehydrogenase (NAD+) catalytic subunit